jgi:hypothetical protein
MKTSYVIADIVGDVSMQKILQGLQDAGLTIVPIKPTERMVKTAKDARWDVLDCNGYGGDCYPCFQEDGVEILWANMLGAAPDVR